MAIKYMEGPFVFRLNDNGTGPHLLVQVWLIQMKKQKSSAFHNFKDYKSQRSSIKHDRNHKLIVIQS